MVKHYEFFVATQDEYYTEYIGDRVKEFVAESGVQNGIVSVVTAHTNCGPTRISFRPTDGPQRTPTGICVRSWWGITRSYRWWMESCAWERRRRSYLWSLTVRRPERFLWM